MLGVAMGRNAQLARTATGGVGGGGSSGFVPSVFGLLFGAAGQQPQLAPQPVTPLQPALRPVAAPSPSRRTLEQQHSASLMSAAHVQQQQQQQPGTPSSLSAMTPAGSPRFGVLLPPQPLLSARVSTTPVNASPGPQSSTPDASTRQQGQSHRRAHSASSAAGGTSQQRPRSTRPPVSGQSTPRDITGRLTGTDAALAAAVDASGGTAAHIALAGGTRVAADGIGLLGDGAAQQAGTLSRPSRVYEVTDLEASTRRLLAIHARLTAVSAQAQAARDAITQVHICACLFVWWGRAVRGVEGACCRFRGVEQCCLFTNGLL
jgi:hypothetical protein